MSKTLKIVAGTPDRPLSIGEISIPCYVLEDETRVLSQRGVFASLKAARGGSKSHCEGDDELPGFANQKWLKPFLKGDLVMAMKNPILFQLSGSNAFGYPATMLVELCDAIIEAERKGRTTDRQQQIVTRAMILIRGFATVGIIALIDEATGYQRIREERSLATILEKFIAKELQSWTKTFPYEFYEQIFRLKGWTGPDGVKRPSVIGRYTNTLVYGRLAPGILEELQKKNPTLPEGGRRQRHHQWFTPEQGHPKLKEHLASVIALMRAAPNWDAFNRSIRRAFPKTGDQGTLYIDDD